MSPYMSVHGLVCAEGTLTEVSAQTEKRKPKSREKTWSVKNNMGQMHTLKPFSLYFLAKRNERLWARSTSNDFAA